MPKDWGQNNKQYLQLTIQMCDCFEVKGPHVAQDGAASGEYTECLNDNSA